jgi:hypothetical protein
MLGLVAGGGAMAWLALSTTGANGEEKPLPRVSVKMLGTAEDFVVEGLEPDVKRAFLRGGDLLVPHILTLHFPDGSSAQTTARSSSISLRTHGRGEGVRYAYIRGPLTPQHFQATVDALLQAIREMGGEPDARTLSAKNWGDLPGSGKGGYPHRVGPFRLAGGVIHVSIDISPDPDSGWHYLLMLGVDQQRLESASLNAATNPSTLPAPPPATPAAQSIDARLESWNAWGEKGTKVDADRALNDPPTGPKPPLPGP